MPVIYQRRLYPVDVKTHPKDEHDTEIMVEVLDTFTGTGMHSSWDFTLGEAERLHYELGLAIKKIKENKQ